MAITPNEILAKEFSNKFRGYDPEQVNDFLDIVRVELERTIQENHDLTNKLADANEKLDYFAQLQESLNSSIIIAQEAADRLKQNARKEAELILFEAEREADRLLKEASDQANNIYDEADSLIDATEAYRQDIRQMLMRQMELIDDPSYLEKFDGTALTRAQMNTPVQPKDRPMSERVDRLVDETDQAMELENHRLEPIEAPIFGQVEKITEEEVVIPDEPSFEEDMDQTQVFSLDEFKVSSFETATQEDQNEPFLSQEELEAYQDQVADSNDDDFWLKSPQGDLSKLFNQKDDAAKGIAVDTEEDQPL